MVNIVIPAFNQVEFCKKCISSIYRYTNLDSFNLILVDNGSTDGVSEYFDKVSEEHDNVIVLHSKRNLGYAGGNNLGLKNIKNKGHVLFLNNDTVVSENWLERMCSIFNKDSEIGIVSPVTNCAGSSQQIRGLNYLDGDENKINEFSNNLWRVNSNKIDYVNRVIGFCMLVRDKVYDNIGLLDERFQIGTYEDDDYCRRVLTSGYKICIARGTFIYHFGSKTFKGMGIAETNKYNELMYTNGRLFEDKWRNKDCNIKIIDEEIVEKNGKVSVIIPCFNYGEYLDECVDSVLNQTYTNYEIIIVDDGSSQETLNVVERQRNKHKNISIIYNGKTKGRSKTRNIAVNTAVGKYILALDSDDKLHKDCIKTMVELIEKNDWDIVYCGVQEFGLSDKKWIPKYDFKVLKTTNLLPCTCLYRKKHWLEIGGYNESIDGYEDWEFWLNMGYNGHFANGTDDVLFYYRKHGKSFNIRDNQNSSNICKTITEYHKSLNNKRLNTSSLSNSNQDDNCSYEKENDNEFKQTPKKDNSIQEKHKRLHSFGVGTPPIVKSHGRHKNPSFSKPSRKTFIRLKGR